MADKEVAHFPQWLLDNQADEFAAYCSRERSNLTLAHYSDDRLANLVFMIGDRSREEDAAAMIEAHQRNDVHISRLGVLTAAKERIRWLSRQVMLLEGTYPGAQKPIPPVEDQHLTVLEVRAKQRLEQNRPLFFKEFDFDPDKTQWSAIDMLVRNAFSDEVTGNINWGLALGYRAGSYTDAWHHYVNLVLLFTKHGKYIPFVGDVIALYDSHHQVIQRSKYHASGRKVRYRIGEVKALTPEPLQIDAEKIWEWLVEEDPHSGYDPAALRVKAVELLPETYVDDKLQPIIRKLIDNGEMDEDGYQAGGCLGFRRARYTHRIDKQGASDES